MIAVPQAASRAGRDPETVRRWIRSGKLRATKVGTQHVIEEDDLDSLIREVSHQGGSASIPERWTRFDSGNPQPDWVAAVHRSRRQR
ncbi:MAG: helix-turn-helix domain-containing protein [Acidimicrobiales bacterium]